jgi:sec-independent protein translocase protein TatA
MLRNLFEGPHLLIVVAVLALLFGAKRLPDAARGLGRSMRIFKSEVKQMQTDDEPKKAQTTQTTQSPIEGAVVPPESTGTPTPAEHRTDL